MYTFILAVLFDMALPLPNSYLTFSIFILRSLSELFPDLCPFKPLPGIEMRVLPALWCSTLYFRASHNCDFLFFLSCPQVYKLLQSKWCLTSLIQPSYSFSRVIPDTWEIVHLNVICEVSCDSHLAMHREDSFWSYCHCSKKHFLFVALFSSKIVPFAFLVAQIQAVINF